MIRIIPTTGTEEPQQNIRIITDTQFVKNEDEASCLIRIEPFEEGETVSKLSCGHTYKPQCIRDWLNKESRCPLCNAED